jgi:chemotaxis methyl-accepting protein methylase
LRWLQDPNEINGDNQNNVRRQASRYFRNKKREYLKNRINVLATSSKNKNIRHLYRGINPSEINGDNLNDVRREASRYFRNKKREYLKKQN